MHGLTTSKTKQAAPETLLLIRIHLFETMNNIIYNDQLHLVLYEHILDAFPIKFLRFFASRLDFQIHTLPYLRERRLQILNDEFEERNLVVHLLNVLLAELLVPHYLDCLLV